MDNPDASWITALGWARPTTTLTEACDDSPVPLFTDDAAYTVTSYVAPAVSVNAGRRKTAGFRAMS